ncbi:hypothetical protein [Kitasatospora cheerisanensis]|nr:hypothetical protein [Kitasatospora cheerisanensis]
MEATDLERIAERARSASRRPTSDQIDEALQDVRAESQAEALPTYLTRLESRLDALLQELRAVAQPDAGAADVVWAFRSVRAVLAESGAAAPEQLAGLPEDLTMADLLEAWAEKQQGGSR